MTDPTAIRPKLRRVLPTVVRAIDEFSRLEVDAGARLLDALQDLYEDVTYALGETHEDDEGAA